MKPRLSKFHLEALLSKQREVLQASGTLAKNWGAYLAGGLAIAEILSKTTWEEIKDDLKKLVGQFTGV